MVKFVSIRHITFMSKLRDSVVRTIGLPRSGGVLRIRRQIIFLFAENQRERGGTEGGRAGKKRLYGLYDSAVHVAVNPRFGI